MATDFLEVDGECSEGGKGTQTRQEQVRMCCLAHGEQAWHYLEPDTGLDHCQIMLLSCFGARISAMYGVTTKALVPEMALLSGRGNHT